MTKNQEFIRILEEIKYREKINQTQIAQKIGIDSHYLSDIKNGRFPLTNEIKDKLYGLFPYLLTQSEPCMNTPGMLPEYSFQFAAGQTWLANENEKINRYWYLPDCTDCEAVVQVAGTSMLPNLPPGCYVALKRYNVQGDNPNTIPFGNVFGIVVEDESTGEWHGHIKVLRRHQDAALASKYWIAHSFNTEEYDDFDIAISQVRSLWIVKQHIVSDY